MLKVNLMDKLKQIVFGDYKQLSLRRRVHILINFITIIIVSIGFTTNILVEMNIWANVVNTIALILLMIFYFHARNAKKHYKTIFPLYISSMFLLALAWFTNSGYDGNITSLYFVFFMAIYTITYYKYRLIVFISSLILFAILVLTHYYYPELIFHYDNPDQRFVDLFFGGLLYLFFMYSIVVVIVKFFEEENKKIADINKELQIKNQEIENKNQILELTNLRFSLAMSASKQAWFEYYINTGDLVVSPDYAGYLGYENNEFYPSVDNWFLNIHPVDVIKVKEAFVNCIYKGESVVFEYRRRTKSGDWKWFKSTAKVIEYDDEGKATRLIGTHMDINYRKIVEEAHKDSELRYRNLFSSMPNGFYRSTPDGFFVDANPAFIKMLGYNSLDELIKLNIPRDIYVSEKERNEILKDNSEFIPQIESYRLKRKDGKIIWIEDYARYIHDENGNILYHEGICQDISERVESLNKIKENESRLNELNKTKDKLFSIIAHDLRNPLGSFKTITRLLFDEYETFDEAERKEFLKTIKESSSQVYSLMENLLEWSRSQQGMSEFKPSILDIRSLVDEIIKLSSASMKDKKINAQNLIPNDLRLNADKNLVNTIIRNLISNSIKFSDYGSDIEIGIDTVYNHETSLVTLYVLDKGIGISEENLEKLFKINNNISTLGTSGEKGTGLGLMLCKEFVEMHNGKIWVESSLGNGSKFYFTLPKI